MLAEQTLGIGAGDAGAELGLAGYLVEAVELIEAAQVERHDGLEVAAQRVEAADHAGPAAERHDRDAALGAVGEDRGDLVVIAGQQNRVGCVLNAGVLAPQQIQGGLAACAK